MYYHVTISITTDTDSINMLRPDGILNFLLLVGSITERPVVCLLAVAQIVFLALGYHHEDRLQGYPQYGVFVSSVAERLEGKILFKIFHRRAHGNKMREMFCLILFHTWLLLLPQAHQAYFLPASRGNLMGLLS